ncbi:MAG TPA: hypothetical protein VEP89_18200 [Draconibacterium sp.]|nr:hypothetical protein [Draconibacterium sp.]
MQEEKKQLEVLLVNYFRDCYTDFPKGKIIPSESPDFVVKIKNKHQLGIELTRLNPVNAVPHTNEQLAENQFREALIDEMRELFEAGSDEKLFVKFRFSDQHKINPERELMVRVETVALIRATCAQQGNKGFYHITLTGPDLPARIEHVMIANHPELKTSVWELSNNLGISNNVVDDIRKAIHKKDEKLRLYQKQRLNQYWLLITTDYLRADKNINLLNKVQREQFQSRYQQVFMLDLIRAKVLPLV